MHRRPRGRNSRPRSKHAAPPPCPLPIPQTQERTKKREQGQIEPNEENEYDECAPERRALFAGCEMRTLPGRLMVGLFPLEECILVRVQARQFVRYTKNDMNGLLNLLLNFTPIELVAGFGYLFGHVLLSKGITAGWVIRIAGGIAWVIFLLLNQNYIFMAVTTVVVLAMF